MSEEYDRIMQMLDDHEKGQDLVNNSSSESQLHKFSWMLIHYVGGIIGIGLISSFIELFLPGSFVQERAVDTAETLAIIFVIIGFIVIAATYSAASAQYGAEMFRRAWTKAPHNPNVMNDFIETVDWGGWAVGYFWAGITVIVTHYYGYI